MESKSLILFVISLLGLGHFSDGAKILFFFAGGTYSHKASIWPFVTALASRGHDVTFFSAFTKRPFEHEQVRDLAPKLMVDAMTKQFENVDRLTKRLNNEETKAWSNYHEDELRSCAAIFSAAKTDPDVHSLFHNETYDLIINNVVFGDCGLVLAHRLMGSGAKLILSSSHSVIPWFYDLYGYPAATAWIPDGGHKRHFPMDFWERFSNFWVPVIWNLKRDWELFQPLERMMREVYGGALEETPSLKEVERNASLIFVATSYATDFPQALPPFIISTGGMQCWQEMEPFEGEFKEYLDKATDGAILIAFGSTVDLSKIPPYFKAIFFDMIREFPEIQFIWRWDGPLPENHPKNLKAAKWLPQQNILEHPNLKAFISHAGLNSLTEATCHGVPVILLPLFADQDYNGYRVEAYEIGIRLEARTLTLEIMVEAVRDILTQERYSKNMKRMSGIMKDRPMNPIETAVFWTEFVLRQEDTSYLKPLNQLYWFQNRSWDVVCVTALLLGSMTLFLLLATRQCLKLSTQFFNKNDVRSKGTRSKQKRT